MKLKSISELSTANKSGVQVCLQRVPDSGNCNVETPLADSVLVPGTNITGHSGERHLPSCRESPPLHSYQIILLGETGRYAYVWITRPQPLCEVVDDKSNITTATLPCHTVRQQAAIPRSQWPVRIDPPGCRRGSVSVLWQCPCDPSTSSDACTSSDPRPAEPFPSTRTQSPSHWHSLSGCRSSPCQHSTTTLVT